jgi:hypothetical protein
MLWLLKDVGAFILGIAGLYLLCFGTLSRKEENESGPQQIRVWMTYFALTILSLGAIVWMVGRAINR